MTGALDREVTARRLAAALDQLHAAAAASEHRHLDLGDRVAVLLCRDRCRPDGVRSDCPLAAYLIRRLALPGCRVVVCAAADDAPTARPRAPKATVAIDGRAVAACELPPSVAAFCRRYDVWAYPELRP